MCFKQYLCVWTWNIVFEYKILSQTQNFVFQYKVLSSCSYISDTQIKALKFCGYTWNPQFKLQTWALKLIYLVNLISYLCYFLMKINFFFSNFLQINLYKIFLHGTFLEKWRFNSDGQDCTIVYISSVLCSRKCISKTYNNSYYALVQFC